MNQEIGYATALGRPTLALVEAEIMPDLKGFIHDQQDLPFSFPGLQNRRREASAFRKACLRLREHLETTSLAKTLQSNISPKRVRAGEEYTTDVRFRGRVRFGFFDNLVVNRASGHQLWQWDPETLPGIPGQPIDLAAGTLNGAVDVTRRYNHSTAGWSPGSYSVYMRLYSHLEPGVLGRQLIAENEHALEVHGA